MREYDVTVTANGESLTYRLEASSSDEAFAKAGRFFLADGYGVPEEVVVKPRA